MTIKCPDCGSVIDIDRLKEAKVFREIVEIYKSLIPLEAGLIDEYVGCFRASAHAQMPSKKYLRILRDVVNLIKTGKFTYDRAAYIADRGLALEALQKTVNTEKRAFRNHNYWKVIMVGMLKKHEAVIEKKTEEARGERREATGKKRDEIPERGVPMPEELKKKLGL